MATVTVIEQLPSKTIEIQVKGPKGDAGVPTEVGFAEYTASVDVKFSALESESGSIRSDFNEFTSSYQTGSFTGSFNGDGSKLTGLDRAYISYFDFSSGLTTTIDTSDTWVKLNTDTTSSFHRDGIVHTNNRATNTGSTRIFEMSTVATLLATNNDEVHVAFFKGLEGGPAPELYPCSEQSVVIPANNRSTAIPFHCITELQTDEYVEVWTKNRLGTANITLFNINVIIKEL